MDYTLIPSEFFLEQLDSLTDEAIKNVHEKINLLKINPYRNKRIHHKNLFLFRIRFKDDSKEKRVIYLVDKPKVKLLCVLDRGKDYKELKRYLKKLGYK